MDSKENVLNLTDGRIMCGGSSDLPNEVIKLQIVRTDEYDQKRYGNITHLITSKYAVDSVLALNDRLVPDQESGGSHQRIEHSCLVVIDNFRYKVLGSADEISKKIYSGTHEEDVREAIIGIKNRLDEMDKTIAAFDKNNSTSIDALTTSNATHLDSFSKANSDSLKAFSDANSTSIKDFSTANSTSIKDFSTANSTSIDALTKSNADHLDSHASTLSTSIDSLTTSNSNSLKGFSDANSKSIDEFKTSNETQLKNITDKLNTIGTVTFKDLHTDLENIKKAIENNFSSGGSSSSSATFDQTKLDNIHTALVDIKTAISALQTT